MLTNETLKLVQYLIKSTHAAKSRFPFSVQFSRVTLTPQRHTLPFAEAEALSAPGQPPRELRGRGLQTRPNTPRRGSATAQRGLSPSRAHKFASPGGFNFPSAREREAI